MSKPQQELHRERQRMEEIRIQQQRQQQNQQMAFWALPTTTATAC